MTSASPTSRIGVISMPASTLFRRATVVDGSGAPAYTADVHVADSRITRVSDPRPGAGTADRVIDAEGLVLSPGFIDVHSHADNAPFLNTADVSKVTQGVTTEVVGNCGFSLAPVHDAHRDAFRSFTRRIFPPLPFDWSSVEEFFSRADEAGHVVNAAPLIGHNALRIAAMGLEARAPRPQELEAMRSQLRRALEAGVFGLSTGLIYPPGVFSEAEELVALAEVLPPDRVYATHMRGEGPQLLQSVAEAVHIAERAGCRLQVSHLKATGKQAWGTVSDALEALDAARAHGLVAHQDVYPYEAAGTMLTACLPPWFQDGGNQAFLARLRSEDALARAGAELERHDGSWENWVAAAGWDRIVVASSATHQYDGMSLAHIAAQKGIPAFDTLVGVLLQEELQVSMTVFAMDEKDIAAAIAHPSSMIGSDGMPPGNGGKPHPRMFGTFPKILAKYVRDSGLLSLPEAIRKMTHLPATAFGIPDRGRVAEGCAADLVLFDAGTVEDHATYEAPDRQAGGIRAVMVNGRIVVEDGEFSGERAGRRLTPA